MTLGRNTNQKGCWSFTVQHLACESCHFQLTKLSRKQQQGQLPAAVFRGCSCLPARLASAPEAPSLGRAEDPGGPAAPFCCRHPSWPTSAAGLESQVWWGPWGWLVPPKETQQGRAQQNAPITGERYGGPEIQSCQS